MTTPLSRRMRLIGLTVGMAGAVVFAGQNAPTTTPAANERLVAIDGVRFAPLRLDDLRARPGPRDGIVGHSATHEVPASGQLPRPLDGRGSLMFWFHTDERYASGSAVRYLEQPLVEIPGVLATTLVVDTDSVILYVGWGARHDTLTRGTESARRGIVFDRLIRVILPELPGPAWHHVAVEWDAARGAANAFLDGTPYNVRGATIAPWRSAIGTEVRAHFNPRLAIADIRVSPSPIADTSTLRHVVGPSNWGRLDALLGVHDLGPAPSPVKGRLLYTRPLTRAEDTRDWILEGPGVLTFSAAGMLLQSRRPTGPNGHVVYWTDALCPRDYLVEFDFEVLSEHGLNIVFFSATGRDGQDISDPALARRDGTFIQYTHGDINSYHISYFANSPNEPRSVANLRKNSGFYLLANGPVAVKRGGGDAFHHAVLVKQGGHIQMAVDGRTIIDFQDDGTRAGPILAGGRVGFRQMQWSATRYRNLRIYSLGPGESPRKGAVGSTP